MTGIRYYVYTLHLNMQMKEVEFEEEHRLRIALKGWRTTAVG